MDGTTEDGQNQENDRPFGEMKPTRGLAFVASITRRLPVWIPRRVVYALRRLVKRNLPHAVDAQIFGQGMRLHPRDNLSENRVLFMPQHFDTEERKALSESLHDEFTFLDIGANAGVYSIFMASQLGARGRIISVEPDPEIRQRLEFNVAANGYNNVTIVPKALSDSTGTLRLYMDRENRGQSSLIDSGGTPVEVGCTTLEQLLDDLQIKTPDAMKIDVEGAELSILRPFFESVAPDRFPGLIILESMRRDGLSEAAQLALKNGYRLRKQAKMNVILEKVAE